MALGDRKTKSWRFHPLIAYAEQALYRQFRALLTSSPRPPHPPTQSSSICLLRSGCASNALFIASSALRGRLPPTIPSPRPFCICRKPAHQMKVSHKRDRSGAQTLLRPPSLSRSRSRSRSFSTSTSTSYSSSSTLKYCDTAFCSSRARSGSSMKRTVPSLTPAFLGVEPEGVEGARRGGDLASLGSSRGLRRSLESLGVLVPLVVVLLPLAEAVFFLGLWVWRG